MRLINLLRTYQTGNQMCMPMPDSVISSFSLEARILFAIFSYKRFAPSSLSFETYDTAVVLVLMPNADPRNSRLPVLPLILEIEKSGNSATNSHYVSWHTSHHFLSYGVAGMS